MFSLYIVIIILIIIIFCNKIMFHEHFKIDEIKSLENIFDSISIITIPERINYVKLFSNSFNINYNIFNAILIKDIKNIYNNKYNLKWGEIACACSHEAVLKQFIKTNFNNLLILEDDNLNLNNYDSNTEQLIGYDKEKHFNKLDYLNTYISNSFKSLPNDWDILYLGRCWDDCNNHQIINKYIIKTSRTLCNHAIVYSKKGAFKILKHIKHPLQYPIDHIIANLSLQNKLNCYATIKPLFFQNRIELGTTIGNFDDLPICL